MKNKPECLALWLTLKDQPAVNSSEPWTPEEEAELVALEAKIEDDIELEGTSYGRHLEAERIKARSVLMAMNPAERDALLSQETAPVNGGEEEDNTSGTDDTTDHETSLSQL